MPSLPQVLHEAANQNASEVVIEAGKEPLILNREGATLPIGVALTETDLFEALSQVLPPEQQAELAVGNVVEFQLDVGGAHWTMLTEPNLDGIVVRGRAHGAARRVEVGAPMDLPPLEPFHPEATVPSAPSPRRTVRETRWDLGVTDATPEPSTPRSSRGSSPPWFQQEAEAPRARPQSGASPAPIPVPDPEPEPDFELRDDEADPSTSFDEDDEAVLVPPPPMGGDDELGAAPPLPDAPSIVHNTGAIPLARVPEAGDGEDDELSQFGQNIGPGSLCLIQGPGVGERFARYVNGGVFTVIEDDDDPDVVMRAVAQEEPGGTYVVRLEDPSRCLGWVLRRLEEGARVMVETRARTIEGARRTLLGVSASPRAETWLEAHALHWLTRRAGIWTLESGSRR